MASFVDDSSMDGSFTEDEISSIGYCVWVQRGDPSDEERDSQPLRPVPFDDGLEILDSQKERDSLQGTSTSGGSQGIGSDHGLMTFEEIHHDTSSELEETNSSAAPSRAPRHKHETEHYEAGSAYASQERPQAFRFPEPSTYHRGEKKDIDVSSSKILFTGQQSKQLCKDPRVTSSGVVGRVRQRMSYRDLALKGPYRVLYVGPAHMKTQIMEKIGSALLSSTSSNASTESDIESSRVTVVPISTFRVDSSGDRDVMLVSSLGLDMSIEECTFASYVKEETWNDTISITLNGHKIVQSSWDVVKNNYVISQDYKLPDLAIIYLPENEEISAKKIRVLVRSFTTRHEIPSILIAAETDWKKPKQPLALDHRSPHLCVETAETQQVLWRMPIDLSTFLEIDPGQMNRNLACLADRATAKQLIAGHSKIARCQCMDSFTTMKTNHPQTMKNLTRLSAVLLFLYASLGFASYFTGGQLGMRSVYQMNLGHPVKMCSTAVTPQAAFTPLVRSKALAKVSPLMTAIHFPKTQSTGLSTVQTKTELASFLPDSSRAINKSDKFKVHVIGDSHVILRPPPWFRMMKKSPALFFRITRQQKVLDYELSDLFDGVYALKLPREDAHGVLDISVWSTRKPRINETIQVDFGTPWLKVAGWQTAAQALTDQVREELHFAQSGLTKAYEHTSIGFQGFMRDAVRRAEHVLKEVEKVGLMSISQTAKRTEIMVSQSKDLTRAISETIHRQTERTSSRWANSLNLRKDIITYTRRMSALFAHQAKTLSEAATGLNVVALAQEIQDYRETHLQEAQKQALHMWWKLRGMPPTGKSKLSQGERLKAHRYRPRSASHR